MFENAAQAQPTERPTENQAQPKQAQTPTEVVGTEALANLLSRHGGFQVIYRALPYVSFLISGT